MMEGPSAANLPRPGDMVAGKYVIDRLLGQGGMGAVFAARHVKLSKPVAIKVMLADPANPEAAHRFINEGRAAANIQNEHVVRVDDVDEELGYAYMVLELLDGEDLSQLLTRQGKLSAPVAADYAIQALRGVMQAHAIGIVHRDLKPSNLFLAKRKDGLVVVKVLDFGISKTQASSALASPSALTSTKAMLGSPLYMSPEQLRSSKSVDQRADIWAMGIILYELVTGTLPYTGENLGELFAAILELDPPPPSVHVQDLPAAFEAVILRSLERRPENRFQTAAELMQALAPFVGAPVRESAPSFHGQPPSSRVSLDPPPSVPSPGATTTGAFARGATIAMSPGATPAGMIQPQVGWRTTGGSSTGLPRTRSTTAFVGVGFGVVAIIGLAGIGASVVRSKAHDRAVPASTETGFAPPPAASLPPVPSLPASATIVTPAGSAAIPPPPVSASAGVKAPPMPVVVHRPAPPVGLVPPVPVSVSSPPPKKPGGDSLQNTR